MANFDELNKMGDDGELTPETLQKALNDYASAIRSEFEKSTKEEPENVIENTRDFFRKNLSSALAQIVWLVNNAESENVRLSASKYVIDVATKEAEEAGDPVRDLLKQLQKA